jgi:hypothetical protein
MSHVRACRPLAARVTDGATFDRTPIDPPVDASGCGDFYGLDFGPGAGHFSVHRGDVSFIRATGEMALAGGGGTVRNFGGAVLAGGAVDRFHAE